MSTQTRPHPLRMHLADLSPIPDEELSPAMQEVIVRTLKHLCAYRTLASEAMDKLGPPPSRGRSRPEVTFRDLFMARMHQLLEADEQLCLWEDYFARNHPRQKD